MQDLRPRLAGSRGPVVPLPSSPVSAFLLTRCIGFGELREHRHLAIASAQRAEGAAALLKTIDQVHSLSEAAVGVGETLKQPIFLFQVPDLAEERAGIL